MTCPKCGSTMRNLGNVSGVVFMTLPAQWHEVHVCDPCKLKRTVSVRGESPPV